MKTSVICLMVLFTVACRPDTDSRPSGNQDGPMVRDGKLSKIMDDFWKAGNPYYIKRDFKFRGPLSIEKVEEELTVLHQESSRIRENAYGATDTFADSKIGKNWSRLKGQYVEGDRLYFFVAPDKRTLTGQIRGYVLVRNKKVIDQVVTIMA